MATWKVLVGNYIMINHGGGLYTRYLHASKLLVSAGTHVTKGQKNKNIDFLCQNRYNIN